MIKHPEKLGLLIDKLVGEKHLQEYSDEEQARLIHRALTQAGIDHWLMSGTVESDGRTIETHYWNECAGLTIDYSLRKIFTEKPGVPHGVFADTGQFLYEGAEIKPKTVSAYKGEQEWRGASS